MTVAQRITDYWPTTEQQLIASDSTTDYVAAKGRAITEAIRRLYRGYAPGEAIPADVDGDPDVEAYVAAAALLRLLPGARDFVKEGYLSRSLSAENGGGSGSEGLYNKLEVFDKLEALVEEDLHGALPYAVAVIVPIVEEPLLTSGSIPTVRRNTNLLLDPIERAQQR